MSMKITYKICHNFQLTNSELQAHLKWWASKTEFETKMLTRTPDFFRTNMVYVIFAFHGEKLVGAAGLIPCLNRHKEKMYFEGKLVLELASNYVEPNYREHHIGTEFVSKRLELCKTHGYFPVSVTGNSTVKQIFSHNGIVMDEIHHSIPGLTEVYREVRVCECSEAEKPLCAICPKAGKSIWAFKSFLPSKIQETYSSTLIFFRI